MYFKGDWKTRKVFISPDKKNWSEISPRDSQKVYNHSPDGFNWGYGGSGPAQLALAILLLLNPEIAKNYYQQFKRKVIAQLPQADFLNEIKEISINLQNKLFSNWRLINE